MAVTIEVSKGRYLRHLREQAGYNQRALTAALNDLLPQSERKTHQWYAALETDTVTKMSVPMALALRQLVGADLDVLGVTGEELDQYRRLFSTIDDPPAQRKNRSRGQPKRPSRCIPDPGSGRLTPPLKCAAFNAAQSWGGWYAYR